MPEHPRARELVEPTRGKRLLVRCDRPGCERAVLLDPRRTFGSRATWPAEGPKEAIDHVFFGPAGRWEVVRVLRGDRVFPDSAVWKARLEALSDHLPVVVEAVLKP
jgi:endonuclease/exonuclease/phosphatase family metal-dependent hydrolase